MNKPNPLVPQGSFAEKGHGHVRITVFAILAVHLVLLGVLLIAGCNKGGDQPAPEPAPTDTGLPPVTPEPPQLPPALPPVATTNPPTALTPPPTSNHVVEAVAPVPPTPPLTPITPPVPDLPPAPSVTEHTIVRGDSFYTLGKKYGVSLKSIAEANPGVDSTKLKLGQKIKIPAKSAPAPSAGAALTGVGGAEVAAPSPSGETTHVVKSGDNLWNLSRKYGVKESAIRSANNLRTSRLVVGQKLKIPGKAAPALEAVPAAPAVPAVPAIPAVPTTPPVAVPPAGTVPAP